MFDIWTYRWTLIVGFGFSKAIFSIKEIIYLIYPKKEWLERKETLANKIKIDSEKREDVFKEIYKLIQKEIHS